MRTAATWGAAEIAGYRYSIMQPASGESVYLRFIERPNSNREARGYQAMREEGWNAIEILAEDPDALAKQLASSAHFKVVGAPRYLTPKKAIKAMQAIGPANELLYLTHIRDTESSGFGLLPGNGFVDRVFIMVVGGKDFDALRNFYRDSFGMQVTEPLRYRIGVLSDTYGLDNETLHEIAIAPISNRFLFELDHYPDAAGENRLMSDGLPDGVIIVSVEVDSLDNINADTIVEPTRLYSLPYNGRRTATVIGPAGEYLELIEATP